MSSWATHSVLPFLPCVDAKDVLCLDSSVVLPDVLFYVRFLRLDGI